jgi:hypothetical protein
LPVGTTRAAFMSAPRTLPRAIARASSDPSLSVAGVTAKIS